MTLQVGDGHLTARDRETGTCHICHAVWAQELPYDVSKKLRLPGTGLREQGKGIERRSDLRC